MPQRVRNLEQQCRQYHRRSFDQPTMWRTGLTAAEEGVAYGGGAGYRGVARGYVTAPELGRAMAAYNQMLLAVCRTDQFVGVLRFSLCLLSKDLSSSLTNRTTTTMAHAW